MPRVPNILHAALMIFFSAAFSEVHASRYATDELSLANQYAYRLLVREITAHPSHRFSDNVKPLSLREVRMLYTENDAPRFLDNQNENYLNTDELLKSGRSFSPVNALQIQNTSSSKENSDIYSNYGERFDGWQNTAISASGNFYLNQYLVASHETRLDSNAASTDLSLYRFRIKTAFDRYSVSYARESLILGPGYFGNLLHSNKKKPENTAMIKIEDPYKIPYLGYFRFYMWWTTYDDIERINKNPNLMGLRFTLKPSKYFETSITRTTFFGGSNNDNVQSVRDLFKIASAKDENSETNINTDQLAAMDISFYVPGISRYSPFKSAKIYSERVWNDLTAFWQSEDESKGKFFQLLGPSMVHGIFLTTGKLDFHLEYVKTTEAIYSHSNFGTDGVTDNGYVIGHFIGRDARAYLSEIYYEASQKIHVYGQLGYIIRGMSLDTNQFSEQLGSGINYFFSNRLQVGLKLNYIQSNRTDVDTSPVVYNFTEEDSNELQAIVRMNYFLQ